MNQQSLLDFLGVGSKLQFFLQEGEYSLLMRLYILVEIIPYGLNHFELVFCFQPNSFDAQYIFPDLAVCIFMLPVACLDFPFKMNRDNCDLSCFGSQYRSCVSISHKNMTKHVKPDLIKSDQNFLSFPFSFSAIINHHTYISRAFLHMHPQRTTI